MLLVGVYLEKVLKSSSESIWMQNVRLAVLGIPISLISIWIKDYDLLEKCLCFSLTVLKTVITLCYLFNLNKKMVSKILLFKKLLGPFRQMTIQIRHQQKQKHLMPAYFRWRTTRFRQPCLDNDSNELGWRTLYFRCYQICR